MQREPSIQQMWYLRRKRESQFDQESFVGGKPVLPVGTAIPTCKLCGTSQAFVFQIAFPADGNWGGRSVAIFSCFQCTNEDLLIPEMLPDPRRGCSIPDDFLTSYQRNFAFLVFPTRESKMVSDYEEQVAFFAIEFVEELDAEFGKIGGSPDWELDDESPATYGSSISMTFLFEVNQGLKLDRVQGAKPQMELNLLGLPAPSPLDHYQLFLGNAVYFLGTTSGEPLVYAITQV